MEQDDSGPSGGARVPVGGVGRDLFVTSRDEAYPSVALEGGKSGDVRVTAQPEDDLDAAIREKSGEVVGNRGVHAYLVAVAMGAWDRCPDPEYRTIESAIRNLVVPAGRCQVAHLDSPKGRPYARSVPDQWAIASQ